MRTSTLAKYYFQLPDAERTAFGDFVRSPLFNQRVDCVRLLEYLESAHLPPGRVRTSRKANGPTLTKERAFAAVYTDGRRYDDNRLRHVMSYLLELLRHFLAWKQWTSDEAERNLDLCRALKLRGQAPLVERELQRARQALEAGAARDTAYFYHQYALELEAWELYRADHRAGDGNLGAVGAAFGEYVTLTTLRLGCAALTQKTVAERSPDLPYLPETLARIEAGAYAGHTVIEIYYYSYKALTEPHLEDWFTGLKARLEPATTLLPPAELRDVYILAINFCIRRLNSGDKHYIAEAFDLYRAGLARGVFLENGYLSPYTYRNILNLALARGEWDWALEYLQTFREHLPSADRDNLFRYNLATYYFRRPDPDRALELLRQVEFRDVLHNLDARRMLLRIFFDRGEEQALESLLESFAVYLQRHRGQLGYHHESYANLVRFVKRLLKLKKEDTAAADKLRADVEKAVHVAEREWLMNRLVGG